MPLELHGHPPCKSVFIQQEQYTAPLCLHSFLHCGTSDPKHTNIKLRSHPTEKGIHVSATKEFHHLFPNRTIDHRPFFIYMVMAHEHHFYTLNKTRLESANATYNVTATTLNSQDWN